MRERGGELVATDELVIVAETLFDLIVVENGKSDGCLAYSTSTNKSERSKIFCQIDELPDQLVSSKEVSQWWRW